MPYTLSHKEEYQGEIPWENTKIFPAMLVEENDLERKIWNMYVEDHLARNYFNDLCQKKKTSGITLLDGLLRWK